MTYKLTDLPEGGKGSILQIGDIGLMRDGLCDLICLSGNRIKVNRSDQSLGDVVISFRHLKLSLSWNQASAIQVAVPC